MKTSAPNKSSNPIGSRIKQQWLDKLWQHLFDGEDSGLLSPGQIRREHRDRQSVRQLEMAAIFEAEQDVNQVHQGLKGIDNFGNLINTPKIDNIQTHAIIENSNLEGLSDVGMQTSASMLQTAVKELRVRDLECALNLRKIILLAEAEIYAAEERAVSQYAIPVEWMICWKTVAQNIFNPELQIVLARMLIHEVARPSSYSMSCLYLLRQFNAEDLEMLSIISKFSFGDFIFNASNSYFANELYHNLLENMDDLGLISGFGLQPLIKPIQSNNPNYFEAVLHCGNKAIQINADSANKVLQLPIYKVSRAGRQLMSLLPAVSDLAYLFEMAAAIKQQGFSVLLGEWVTGSDDSYFVQKMPL